MRSGKSKKDRQYNGKRKRTIGKTTIYKTFHRKLKIEQHKPQQKQLPKNKQLLLH
jgi:hypothetical protein